MNRPGFLFRCLLFVAAAFANMVTATAADEGLLGHWVFDETHIFGQGLPDMAGKTLAIIKGPVRISRPGALEALELDDKTLIQLNKNLERPPLPKRNMTAEAWVRIDRPHPWGGIIGYMQDNGDYERGWILGFSGRKFSFAVKTKGAHSLTYLTASQRFQLHQWYHVVGTYDGTEQKVYVDGKLEATSQVQHDDIDYPPWAYYEIGAYRDADEFYPVWGAVHEIRVYNRALSQEEITKLYQQQARDWSNAARLRTASIFGSNMVLERDRKLPVWGWAKPGDRITVTLGTDAATAVTDATGAWKLTLPPQKAGGPFQLSVAGNQDRITLDNVLVGEVWLCSGQSNMQFPVQSAGNAQHEIRSADEPKIRLFTISDTMDPEPLPDCNGAWQVCRPESVAGFSAVGYYFGRQLHQGLHVPIGLINASWGGSLCEAWMSREALRSDPDFAGILEKSRNNPWLGRGMFNAMIHPIIPFAMQGVIWYQGEANSPRADQYRKLFPALIRDWRIRWGEGDFPFDYVQLCPFKTDPNQWAELWDAQRRTLSVSNTGMVVTTDIGELRNIHPRNKQEVGRRLALWALYQTYNRKDLVPSGPLYSSMKVEGDAIRVRFDYAHGLASRDGQPLNWFSIAGQDRVFHPAQAAIDGDTLLVRSDEVFAPVAVRFAWSSVAQPNFVNQAGLPASPFRTDDWPLVTAGADTK